MRKLFALCSVGFALMVVPLSAQEICNNGRDDDNDGFIDCADWDCSNNPEVTVCTGPRVCQ